MSRQLSATERIALLEEKMNGLDRSLDLTLEQVRDSMGSTLTVLDAVVSVFTDLNLVADLGQKIQDKIVEKRQARVNEQLDQETKQRQALVSAGVMKPAEVVTDKSVLVVTVKNPNSEVVGLPARAVEYSQLKPDVGPKFLGQKVGFVLTSEQGETIEILELYDSVPTPEVSQVQVTEPVAS